MRGWHVHQFTFPQDICPQKLEEVEEFENGKLDKEKELEEARAGSDGGNLRGSSHATERERRGACAIAIEQTRPWTMGLFLQKETRHLGGGIRWEHGGEENVYHLSPSFSFFFFSFFLRTSYPMYHHHIYRGICNFLSLQIPPSKFGIVLGKSSFFFLLPRLCGLISL